MSVNKYDSTTGALTSVAASGRVWIGTKAQHAAAVQAGTMPNNCLVSITDDDEDSPARLIAYDNTESELEATNVQDALDELKEIVDGDSTWGTNGSIHYKKVNGVVTIYTDPITTINANWATIGTLPEGYRPASLSGLYVNVFSNTTDGRYVNFFVANNGAVMIYNNYGGNVVPTITYVV